MTRVVFKSLHRHALVLGGERELVQFAALISFIVGAGGQTMLSVLASFVFWCGAVFCLRKMANSDPCMRHVFIRHVKQQAYYRARTSPWAK